MSGLVEFLTARLDEDEARARLIPDPVIDHEGDCCGTLCEECGHCCHSSDPCEHDCGCKDALPITWPWAHLRVLADVAAKRAVLAELGDYADGYVWASGEGFRAESALMALAQPYADHPDFDPKWLT